MAKLKYYAKLQLADCIDYDGNEFIIHDLSLDDWVYVEIVYANTNRVFFYCEAHKLFDRICDEFPNTGKWVCNSLMTQINSIAENITHLDHLKKVVDRIPALPSKLRKEVNKC